MTQAKMLYAIFLKEETFRSRDSQNNNSMSWENKKVNQQFSSLS